MFAVHQENQIRKDGHPRIVDDPFPLLSGVLSRANSAATVNYKAIDGKGRIHGECRVDQTGCQAKCGFGATGNRTAPPTVY